MNAVLAGFIVLFNGQNLDDWQVRGGRWAVRDGLLVCDGGTGWLRSEWEYEDFVLRLEWRAAKNARGGVFVRSSGVGDPWPEQYRVELGEGVRGDVTGLVPAKEGLVKPAGQWNLYEIMCIGNEIRLKINGEFAYNPDAKKHPPFHIGSRRGYIGLQADGSRIEFRNIAVREIGFQSLFNSKDLTGWVPMGKPERWTVEDGKIVGLGGGGWWLRTEKEYHNFVLRIEYKIAKGGNSGVFVRSGLQGNPAYTGMESQILDDCGRPPAINTSGAIYGSLAPRRSMSRPAGQWNYEEITCDGELVKIWMNGEPIIETRMNEHPNLRGRLRRGYIGVQDHGARVEFRNIRLEELPSKSDEPAKAK